MKRLLLVLPLLACVAPDWLPFSIDKRVSVQLPAKPTEVDLAKLAPGQKIGHTRMWVLRAPEGIYQVMRVPTGMMITQQDDAARNSFYQGMIDSEMRKDKGQLVALIAFPTSAGAGMGYQYKVTSRANGQRVFKSIHSLVVDSVAYSFNFTPAKTDSTGLAGTEQRNKFFGSITANP